MSRLRPALSAFLCPAALFASMLAAPPGGDRSADADEKLLRHHKVPADGPGLLDFFRKQTARAISEDRIKALIEQLGDDSFEKREEATRELIRLGNRARRFLKEALRHTDLEIRSRAERCLREVEKDGGVGVTVNAAAVRVLARLRPDGAVAVLLDYLPAVQDESVAGEVREALTRLAVAGGKASPVLVNALKDRSPTRRTAAALALCRAKASDQMPAVRKLLADPDAKVRLSVALALVALRERAAMPVLIALMDQPPTPELGRVEDLLFRLAGEKSPVLAGADEASRKKYRAAWEEWWKEHGAKIDLAVLEESARVVGHTTVVLLDKGTILDLDASNRVRWTIEGVQTPLDVQRLPGDRVLIAEYKADRVTERNSKGEVVWEHKVPQPLMAQRLANGNTFIAKEEGVIEIDPKGKEVFRYSRPAGEQIVRARKLPGGDIVLVTELGVKRFVRIDRFGRQVANFGVEVNTVGGRIDLTPAGNVLIPELHNHRVVERDMDGKVVRTLAVQQPIAAVALPNGHVLVTSMSQNRAVEFDRTGKEVWEYRRDTRVTRAVRH
jgi:HEAT repeat protein